MGSDYFAAVRAEYRLRRDTVHQKLTAIPGVVCAEPKGAFYVMAKLPVDDAEDFQTWLLQEFDDNGETVMFCARRGILRYSWQGGATKCAWRAWGDLERAMICLPREFWSIRSGNAESYRNPENMEQED